MKQYFAKLLAFIFCLIFLVSLNTGCNESISDKNETGKGKLSSNVLGERPDPVTITYYFTIVPYGDDYEKQCSYMRKVFEKIEEETRDILNIHFEIKYIKEPRKDFYDNSEIEEATSKLLESGAEFDIINLITASKIFARNYGYADLIDKGYFLDLTDLFPKYAPEYYSTFTGDELRSLEYNGRLYCIPGHMGANGEELYIAVSSQLMDKYGIGPIKTLEDYENYLETISENERGLNPWTNMSGLTILDQELLARAYGYVLCNGYMAYRYEDPEMKLLPWEQTGAFREAAALIKRWQDYSYNYLEDFKKPFASFLSIESDPEFIPYPAPYKDDKWVVYPLNLAYPGLRTPLKGTYYISSKSKNIERILKFVEWMQSDEANNLLCNAGIEGVNYRMEDGKIVYEKNRQLFCQIGLRRDKARYKKSQGVSSVSQDEARFPPHAGFVPDALLRSKLEERIEFFDNQFDSRNKNLSNLDVDWFITELRQMGADNITAEMQKQLDEWREKYRQ